MSTLHLCARLVSSLSLTSRLCRQHFIALNTVPAVVSCRSYASRPFSNRRPLCNESAKTHQALHRTNNKTHPDVHPIKRLPLTTLAHCDGRFLSTISASVRSRSDGVKEDSTGTVRSEPETEKALMDSSRCGGELPAPISTLSYVEEDRDGAMEDAAESSLDILADSESPEILEQYSTLPLMAETYTLATYVDQSETLQKLVQMGVDLSKIEQRKGVASMLLRMDFDRDIKDKLAFLHREGVPGERLGAFLTRNPFILGEEVETLEARTLYLREKGFSKDAISQIITRAPYFLNFSVERIDNKLGYYQELLNYSDSQIREVITRCPKLVTMKVSRPKENLFVLEFQCGFSRAALRSMVLAEPAILQRGKMRLISTFDYLHNVMKIPHKVFMKSPNLFLGRVERVKDRHKYLKTLQRDQYDTTQPGYVPVAALFKLPDNAFCTDLAKTSLQDYEHFLKASHTG